MDGGGDGDRISADIRREDGVVSLSTAVKG